MTDLPPVMYGVWIPGEGWLKVNRNGALVPFADVHQDVATELANHLGRRAKVRYIDDSIAALEGVLLDAERSKRIKIWDTLTSYKRTNSR